MSLKLKFQKGFTLVEVMVSVGILGILGGVSSYLVANMYETQRYYMGLQEYNDLYRITQVFLTNNSKCPLVLRDATGLPNTIVFTGVNANVDGLYSPNGPIVKSNTVVGGGRLAIGNIYISEVIAGSSQSNQWALNSAGVKTYYNTYLININIPAKIVSSNKSMQLSLKPLPIKIYVNPSNGNKIEACAAQVAESSTCASFGGVYDSTSAKCVMPLCNASTVTIPCTPDISTSAAFFNCQPKVYYWVISQTGTTSATQSPQCFCEQRCLIK
jgi:prepilin-type N-terminal cleavage/methylation domain-containing protein